jgi:hypothetical protein
VDPSGESPFTGEVLVEQLDETRWRVMRELRYRGRSEEFVVPEGL